MRFLAGFLTFISSFFAGDSPPKLQPLPPLNTAIISFQNTYYTPAVANPDNFPKTKSVTLEISDTKFETKPKIIAQTPIVVPPPMPLPLPPQPPALTDTGDPYIPNDAMLIDQSTQWLKTGFSLNGSIYDGERNLSNIAMDREYWKVEVLAYWAPGIKPPRPPLEKDFFKLEIYDEKTNKLIYTMTSGSEEYFSKKQIFKKSGQYTFKASSKTNGQYEINFLVSPKMAK